MISESKRGIARLALLLGVLWAAFMPALYHPCDDVVFVGVAVAAISALLMGRICFLSLVPFALYFVAVIVILYGTQNFWLFPPILWGMVIIFALFGVSLLALPNEKEENDHASQVFHPSVISPHFWKKRFTFLLFLWIVGEIYLSFQTEDWRIIVMFVWTMVMFFAFQAQIAFVMNEPWIGFRMRRLCFLDKTQWRRKWIRDLVISFLCLGIAIYILLSF